MKHISGGQWVIMEDITTGQNYFGDLSECQVIGSCAADQNQNFWSVKYCKDNKTASSATNELMTSYKNVRFQCF